MFSAQSHRKRNQSLMYRLEESFLIPTNGKTFDHNNHSVRISPKRFCSAIVSPVLQKSQQCSLPPFPDIDHLQIQQQNPIFKLHNIIGANSGTIKEIAPLHLKNALYLLQQCLAVCKTKIKRQGEVVADISEIRITKQGKICPQIHEAWITVNLSPNIIDELKIVRLLIQQTLVLSDQNFLDFDKFFMRSCHKLNLDFKGAIKLIKTYSSCAKISLSPFFAIKNQDRIRGPPKRSSPSIILPKTTKFFQTNQTDFRSNKKPSFLKGRESNNSLTSHNKISFQFNVIIKSKSRNSQIPNFNKNSITSALTKQNSETNSSSQINQSDSNAEWINFNSGSCMKKLSNQNLSLQASPNFTCNFISLFRNQQISEVISECESSTQRSYPEDFNVLALGIQGKKQQNKTVWPNEQTINWKKGLENKTGLIQQSSKTGYNDRSAEEIPIVIKQTF